VTSHTVQLELDDLQGNVVRGYGHPHVAHLFGAIAPQNVARWRRALLDLDVTAQGFGSKPAVTRNVGISHAGMSRLIPNVARELERFEAFVSGMRARATLLGDPADVPWDVWDDRDVWIAVHAADRASLHNEVSRLRLLLAGLSITDPLYGEALLDQHGHWIEPFGFRDDISQPAIEGAPNANKPGLGKLDRKLGNWLPIAAGEFVLGHPNERGRNVLDRLPTIAPMLKNGTFAVFRELVQDVAAFKQTLAHAAATWKVPVGTLQAQLVGRHANGEPLAKLATPGELSDFTYDDDAQGSQCPIGAHVRRANPRRSGEHRLIRRGMPYRKKATDRQGTDVEGLYLVAFNASIENQFEFIQSTWLNTAAGALPGSRDPLVGEGAEPRAMLVEGDAAAQRDPIILSLPRFVTCRGGQYYFVPGLEGLRQIAGAACAAAGANAANALEQQ
jgi:Dyp-type peroxidase family